jgi:parvulin-like peptidyl-prolyl isomerase
MTLRTTIIGTLILPLWLALPLAHAQEILVARANGTGITQEQLERNFDEDLKQRKLNLLQIRNPERMKQMKRAVLDKLIEQELFWQQAQKAGTIASPDEVEQAYQSTMGQFKSAEAFERRLLVEGYTPETYRQLVKKQVSATKYANGVGAAVPAASSGEVHQFYLDNPEKFRRPQQVRARHILISVAPAASDKERAATRLRIDQILARARAGEDFETLARLYSEATTKQWGGELEPFSRGQLAKPFEDVAFGLKPGQVSDVLATPEGLQIIKLDTLDPAIIVSEQKAREKIQDFLRAQKANLAVEKEAARLRTEGIVDILLPL